MHINENGINAGIKTFCLSGEFFPKSFLRSTPNFYLPHTSGRESAINLHWDNETWPGPSFQLDINNHTAKTSVPGPGKATPQYS